MKDTTRGLDQTQLCPQGKYGGKLTDLPPPHKKGNGLAECFQVVSINARQAIHKPLAHFPVS